MSLPKDVLNKISQSIIANQVALDLNHEIKFTKYFKMNMKSAYKKYEWHLLKAEKEEFEMLWDGAYQETHDTHFAQTEIIKEILNLGKLDFELGEAIEALKALKKDPKRLKSIVKKINSNE